MERTLTFTFEDALLSPLSFSLLSGSNLLIGKEEEKVHVHTTIEGIVEAGTSGKLQVEVTDALGAEEEIDNTTYMFVMKTIYGGLTGDTGVSPTYKKTGDKKYVEFTSPEGNTIAAGDGVLIDCYIAKTGNSVAEIQITGEDFAGAYYVEFETMFREYGENTDHPTIFTIPNAKLQSNFNFSFAGTGDPSTFSFTLDAFPGYTLFNPAKRVLCAAQIVGDAAGTKTSEVSVFPHDDSEKTETE